MKTPKGILTSNQASLIFALKINEAIKQSNGVMPRYSPLIKFPKNKLPTLADLEKKSGKE